MSGATDSGMIKMMGLVMGALALFAIIIALASRMIGGEPDDPNDPMKRNALIQRIEPVASVRTSADELPAVAGTAVIEVAGAPKTGAELVDGACAACHVAGVAEAPKLDDEAAWATRREAGLDALVASVINGKGAMPARGGSTYSDEEIRRAVEQIAGFEVEESAAASAAEAPLTETAGANAESDADAQEAPMAETPAEAAAESATATATATATEMSAGEATESADEAAVPLVVGQVPDGLTDKVKNTVDGLCVSCHIAGVANAPKIGDTAAWQARADKGLAVLTTSVTEGLNAMPPRGGSDLTDEEIPMAIQYLLSK